MRRPGSRFLVALAVTLPLSFALAACGSDDSPSSASETVAVPAGATIIDVRTPDEFAEGHLDGAVNLKVEDGTLAAALADLDPTANYIVYCRSGRRSALAAEQMAAAGFADVTDLGGIDEAAAATKLPIVSGG
jgi:phage shock protein E